MDAVINALWHMFLAWLVIVFALFVLAFSLMIFGASAKDAGDTLVDMMAGTTPIINVVVPGIGIVSYAMNRLEEIVEGEHARN